MKNVSFKAVVLVPLLSAALAGPALATPADDCHRAIDQVSISGPTNYDSATEAEMTKYISDANVLLMQNQKAESLGELKKYQKRLSEAVKAKKVTESDHAMISEQLNKAMTCIENLK